MKCWTSFRQSSLSLTIALTDLTSAATPCSPFPLSLDLVLLSIRSFLAEAEEDLMRGSTVIGICHSARQRRPATGFRPAQYN